MSESSQIFHIPFAKVDCSGNELAYIKEVLEDGWLTTGQKAIELENRFASMVGANNALAVSSCTAALHLALEALGIGPESRVLVPTLTFTATAEVVRYLGAEPVLMDVDPLTGNITPDIVRDALCKHKDISTLIVVHYGGLTAPMLTEEGQGIMGLCREAGISVVEDAAHAFPSRQNGQMVGTIGDITCFSFYANKTITTGEGGMLTCHSAEIARRVKLMRQHGIDRDVWQRYQKSGSWEYDVLVPGFKYNLPDLNAAVGLAQLERAEKMRKGRQQIAAAYTNAFSSNANIGTIESDIPPENRSWHLFPIFFKNRDIDFRNRVIEQLNSSGIGTSVHYKPLHRLSYYRDTFNLDYRDYPGAEVFWNTSVSLPIYHSLTSKQVNYITEVVNSLSSLQNDQDSFPATNTIDQVFA